MVNPSAAARPAGGEGPVWGSRTARSNQSMRLIVNQCSANSSPLIASESWRCDKMSIRPLAAGRGGVWETVTGRGGQLQQKRPPHTTPKKGSLWERWKCLLSLQSFCFTVIPETAADGRMSRLRSDDQPKQTRGSRSEQPGQTRSDLRQSSKWMPWSFPSEAPKTSGFIFSRAAF